MPKPIVSGAILGISDGLIRANSAGSGGGVQNFGTLTITNGAINANIANAEFAGGVNNLGTVALQAGLISGNTARFGAGVSNGPKGIFDMSGGKYHPKLSYAARW